MSVVLEEQDEGRVGGGQIEIAVAVEVSRRDIGQLEPGLNVTTIQEEALFGAEVE